MFDSILQNLTLEALVLFGVIFMAGVGLVWGIISLVAGNETVDHLDAVLGGTTGSAGGSARQSGNSASWVESIAKFAKPVAKFTKPFENWETSTLKRRFLHAGWRHPLSSEAFFGAKGVMALALPSLGFFLNTYLEFNLPLLDLTIFLLVCGLAGYYLPNFWLNRAIRLRQREIFENFPDALDLLTICIEAGLGLDAALQRVSVEMRLSSNIVADEFELVTLEMRAGAGKERALRNLALRTGVEDIESTVATLIQSERFGTSIGESLRVQSDMLRSKRQLRAEELAAKIAVKLVFPLVICILPTIFIVAAGPAMIQIGRSFKEIFGGG